MMLTRRTAIALLGLVAAPALAQSVAPVPTPAPGPAPASNLPRVAVTTTAGRFVVEADIVHAPITAGNFLKYVDQKRLDGVSFYRVVKPGDRFGFVQFGPQGDPKRILPPIKHEPTSQTGIKHTDGTLSIARLGPGTANSEFTIMVGDQPSMDADSTRLEDAYKTKLGYAAWGHVVEGMDVVVNILNTPVSPTKAARGGAFKGEMPVTPVTILTARRVRP